ncbi:NADP-dependent oxidoreductase domain-containing protein [Chytriomyces sp. MP71]|nr:NADP-dependent oxidoreductase domain-containing protein [Chytriomyces sp. MP71]
MTFGTGVGGRISDRDTIQQIVDEFTKRGHTELDTARMYCEGNTEEVLSELKTTGLQVHTKVYPFKAGDHEPEKLMTTFRASLKALQRTKVDIFYLHAPDHSVPFERTLGAVQELYLEGTFTELGLSNYASWQVMQIYHICKSKGYVLPTLYQGMYNALTRDAERELLPCLRELGMRFYAYNPLCGGLLSGHHKFETNPDDGARFDPKTSQGERYRGRYWNETYFKAVEHVKAAVAKHEGMTLLNAAHRWMFHHSMLDQSKGDGVIIGVSSVAHAVSNLNDCEQGELPADIVAAFDEAYAVTKPLQANYFR